MEQSANSAGDGRAEDGAEGEQDGGAEEFVLMRLKRGDVFPPHSGQMQGGRLRKDDADFDKVTIFTRLPWVGMRAVVPLRAASIKMESTSSTVKKL